MSRLVRIACGGEDALSSAHAFQVRLSEESLDVLKAVASASQEASRLAGPEATSLGDQERPALYVQPMEEWR